MGGEGAQHVQVVRRVDEDRGEVEQPVLQRAAEHQRREVHPVGAERQVVCRLAVGGVALGHHALGRRVVEAHHVRSGAQLVADGDAPVPVARVEGDHLAYGGADEQPPHDRPVSVLERDELQRVVVRLGAEVQHVHGVRLEEEARQVGTDEAVAEVVAPVQRLLRQSAEHGAAAHVHDDELHRRVGAIQLQHGDAVTMTDHLDRLQVLARRARLGVQAQRRVHRQPQVRLQLEAAVGQGHEQVAPPVDRRERRLSRHHVAHVEVPTADARRLQTGLHVGRVVDEGVEAPQDGRVAPAGHRLRVLDRPPGRRRRRCVRLRLHDRVGRRATARRGPHHRTVNCRTQHAADSALTTSFTAM